MTIQNSGDSVLSWIIEGNEEWVSFSPTSGEIIPSSVPTIVELKIDPDGLDIGEYTVTTIISGNYDNYSQETQISLPILPAPILDRILTSEDDR